MKKTIPTSIANTLFYIEEDTYGELDAYLSSIRLYFASYADNIEIIKDIESRIAEQFIDYTNGAEKNARIITKDDVDKLIVSMGKPEDFGEDGQEKDTRQEEKKTKTPRKFYRDTEHGIAGGVASGIAVYFGIDPLLVRVLFFVSIFFGGAGILVYIFLWIAIPAATTASQKLEMQGDPVNLQSVGAMAKEKIKDKMNEIDRDDTKKKFKNIAERFQQFFTTVGKRFFQVFGGIIGVSFKIVSILAIIGITSGFIIAVVNPGVGMFDLPSHAIISLPLYYLLISIVFFIGIIPFIFIYSLGTVLLGKKTNMRGLVASALIGLWMVAVIVGITTAVSVGFKINNYTGNHKMFAEPRWEVLIQNR